MNVITLDATNKKIGRVASQAAKILMGKTSPAYKPNAVLDVKVKIENTSKADISAKKKDEKEYTSYSGFPGGLKTLSMEKVIARKGASEIFRIAVKGMLPKNKLQAQMMKNLTVTE